MTKRFYESFCLLTKPMTIWMVLLLLIINITSISNADKLEYPETPAGVVNEFLNEDYSGSALNSSTWYKIQRLTTWEDGPGWDRIVIVSAFNSEITKLTDSSAEIKVDYQIIGMLESGEKVSTFKENINKQVVKFILIKEESKWKISGPQNEPHVSVDKAIQILEDEMTPDLSVKEKYCLQKSIKFLDKHRKTQ